MRVFAYEGVCVYILKAHLYYYLQKYKLRNRFHKEICKEVRSDNHLHTAEKVKFHL